MAHFDSTVVLLTPAAVVCNNPTQNIPCLHSCAKIKAHKHKITHSFLCICLTVCASRLQCTVQTLRASLARHSVPHGWWIALQGPAWLFRSRAQLVIIICTFLSRHYFITYFRGGGTASSTWNNTWQRDKIMDKTIYVHRIKAKIVRVFCQ